MDRAGIDLPAPHSKHDSTSLPPDPSTPAGGGFTQNFLDVYYLR
jgi:hypothetical protein